MLSPISSSSSSPNTDAGTRPKYLFGESYGTTRSAVLSNVLETERDLDLNGVILLSQILSYDLSPMSPEFNPSIDLPYELALPTYAATAWYHHKLPDAHPELAPLLTEVEHFAMTEYAEALEAGSSLAPEQRQAVVAKLHQYTGLPVEYIEKANLRVSGGEFEKTLAGRYGFDHRPPRHALFRALPSTRSAKRRATIRKQPRSALPTFLPSMITCART